MNLDERMRTAKALNPRIDDRRGWPDHANRMVPPGGTLNGPDFTFLPHMEYMMNRGKVLPYRNPEEEFWMEQMHGRFEDAFR